MGCRMSHRDKYADITAEISDRPLFQNIHELRRTEDGRELLRSMGKLDRHSKPLMKNREFIAWDGEGITDEDETAQDYVLFGASTGDYIRGRALSTRECLRLIVTVGAKYPYSIHVGYSFGYDTEQILRDLSAQRIQRIMDGDPTRWRGYTIHYVPRKWLSVTGWVDDRRVHVKIWDVFTFFATTFLKACRQYLGEREDLARIESGKAARDSFTREELDSVILPYWRTELRLLVELCGRLRELMLDIGLNLTSWHGPGAVASALYSRERTQEHKGISPCEVLDASQYAFAGGRFEQFRAGRINEPIYRYDIRSAYPAAIRHLPSLANCEWSLVERPSEIAEFGVYLVLYRSPAVMGLEPQPLFQRDRRGKISYPRETYGWYWSPEARIARDAGGTVLCGWTIDSVVSPFEWVHDMYVQRNAWKREGIQAQLALKLGLNSLYGKMAQQRGWKEGQNIPKWHQLEWAGWVTSYTRAKLWEGIQQAWKHGGLIACETDSVFSTVELDLPLSENLGDWEMEKFDDCIYLQNGIYWLCSGGTWTLKYRGLDPKSLTIDDTMRFLSTMDIDSEGSLQGSVRRFTSWNLAKGSSKRVWRAWVTEPREITIGVGGKRVHNREECQCLTTAHMLSVPEPSELPGYPHAIPWRRNPDPLPELS